MERALREIDLIQEAKRLRAELDSLRIEVTAGQQQRPSKLTFDDDRRLSTEEVCDIIGKERTYLWELEQVGFLKPFEKRRNRKSYRARDVNRYLAMDPSDIAIAVRHWRESKDPVPT